MKNIILNMPAKPGFRNKPLTVPQEHTLERLISEYIADDQRPAEKFFPAGEQGPEYLVFVNGNICRDKTYTPQENDRIFITAVVGGG